MKLKEGDSVKYYTGIRCTVLKIYKDLRRKKIYVQALSEVGLIYDKLECFKIDDK